MERSPEKRVITFYVDVMTQMRYYLQLKYDDIKCWEFLRIVIDSYVERDPLFITYINKKLEARRSIKRNKSAKKDAEISIKTDNNFALNEEEIENIFSIIETENPDL